MKRLPERDLKLPAEQQGLFRKFDVARVDESDQPGRKHHDCEYFVLDVNHDPYAHAALAAYATACETTHPELSADLRQRFNLPDATEAEMVCYETYQVVGSMLSDLGQFKTAAAEKVLDNLSNARMVHLDVLPWPSFTEPGVTR